MGNILNQSNHHTTVPNVGDPPRLPGKRYSYTLTDAEMEHLRTGRLDLIPTGEQRGIEPEIIEPKVPKEYVEPAKRVYPAPSISKEYLQEQVATGKTNKQIAAELGRSASSISSMMHKYGLTRSDTGRMMGTRRRKEW